MPRLKKKQRHSGRVGDGVPKRGEDTWVIPLARGDVALIEEGIRWILRTTHKFIVVELSVIAPHTFTTPEFSNEAKSPFTD